MGETNTVSLAVLLGLAGVSLFLLWPAPGQPGASLKTMARLAPGMSEAQVVPKWATIADVDRPPPAGFPPAAPGGRLLEYTGDRSSATIEFGQTGGWSASIRSFARSTSKSGFVSPKLW